MLANGTDLKQWWRFYQGGATLLDDSPGGCSEELQVVG
jgi:hypothetical protein